MTSKPSPLISYAQNGEDIVLARALNPWEKKGFWVDCGAGHPKYDSVTKLFSQFGWTGINIEPLDQEFLLLTQDRPQDENIQCLLGAKEGVGIIFAGPAENRGSSTSDPLLVDRYATEFSQTFQKFEVPMRRLDDILREKDRPNIDFLKIDVEGAEEEVLKGIDLREFNPRVLVIESTQPNSTEPSFAHWEKRVLSSGYRFALFDGLNRYYVHENELVLLRHLSIPFNILDDYKTIVHLEMENHSCNLNESNKASILYAESLASALEEKEVYAESLASALGEKEVYAESLASALGEKDLLIADQKQQVIDVEIHLVTLKKAIGGLEEQLVILHDVKRQLNTIRSYKLFRLLSLIRKVLRKISGLK